MFFFAFIGLYGVAQGQIKPKVNPVPTSPLIANIVGGNGTTINSVPWQALINTTENKTSGACIVGPYTILTAAHSVINLSPSQVLIYAGFTFFSQAANGQVRGVSRISIHPNYNPSTGNADIAVLELSSPLNFNSDVQPIRFDGGTAIETPGTTSFISGWGLLSEGGNPSNQLQLAAVPIGDINTLQQSQYSFPLNNGMIPVGGFTSHCNGDSGGPAWVNSNGQNFLIGVCSFKPLTGCGSSNPGIYTRVSTYCSWILQEVSNAASIIGSGSVCNSTDYSVSNQPLNTSVSWASSNPTVLSIDNNGVATRQNNFNDIVTITAIFTNNCGSGSYSRSVTVGPPLVSSILVNGQPSSPASICVNNFASVDVVPSDPNASYNWSVSDPGNAYLTNYSNSNTVFNAYIANCYDLNLQVSNACGFTQRIQTICAQNCFARYIVYPNPAKEYIKVEFEPVEKAEALPDKIDLLSENSTKSAITVNVQDEYKNNKLVNGKSVILPVKDLPRGTYYLQISNSRRQDKSVDKIRILLE